MKRVGTLAAVAASLALAACGSSSSNSTSTSSSSTQTSSSRGNTIQSNAANKGKTVTIGSKNFTEEFILGEIYAQALQAAGYNVKKDLNFGSEQIAFKALKTKDLDGYPEYTSTALTSFFGKKVNEVPSDASEAL